MRQEAGVIVLTLCTPSALMSDYTKFDEDISKVETDKDTK